MFSLKNLFGGSGSGSHLTRLDISGKAATRAERRLALVTPSTSSNYVEDEHFIDQIEDLPRFSNQLYDQAKMGDQLRNRICPVQLRGSEERRFALVVTKDEIGSQVALKICVELENQGFLKSKPLYYVAGASVLTELKMNGQGAKTARLPDSHDNGALRGIFNDIVVFSIKNNVSDIHIKTDHREARAQVQFKIDGVLCSPPNFRGMSRGIVEEMLAYVFNILGQGGSQSNYSASVPQQQRIPYSTDGKNLLFRWASHPWMHGTKVVNRMLQTGKVQQIRTLEELGFFGDQIEQINRALMSPNGGIIFSGSVGSGKSTTLQTCMSSLPDTIERYSVEDPVEYEIPGVTQINVSRSMSDTDSDPFVTAKRQLKRMDPGAVLIGEIRDRESAGMFRDINESGHLALTTLHAPSAVALLTTRLVSTELGIPRDIIAIPEFLRLLVYQALVPRLCTCAKPALEVYESRYINYIAKLFAIDGTKIRARNKDGCGCCRREGLAELNGLKGRIVVAEIVEPDAIILDLVHNVRNAEIITYWRSTRNGAKFDEPKTIGKSAMEVAIYHLAHGVLDPRVIESKFGSFEQYEKSYLSTN